MNKFKKIISGVFRMNKFKKIILGLLCVSSIIPLTSDIIYGTKAKAEEYMFGLFLSNISMAAFTLLNLIILLSIVFYFIVKKIFPSIPKYITEEINKPKEVSDE